MLRDWTELLRVSALFTVPGDAVAGAAAVGVRADRRTLSAIGCSLCLYQAGMVLNDWADRDEDARERPHRPLPSGRIRPAAALGAAIGLTGAGLALAVTAGRPAAVVAGALAATVWAYDVKLKHTSAGPVAMAAARGLDLLLGAAAVGGGLRHRAAGTSAALLAMHTLAVTCVSRNETTGGSTAAPLTALAATTAIGTALGTRSLSGPRTPRSVDARTAPGAMPGLGFARAGSQDGSSLGSSPRALRDLAVRSLAAAYVGTAARPFLHATLNPSPPLTQRAVGGGIRALIPLQAVLTARAGAPALGAALMTGLPIARGLARKVSPT